MKTHLKTMIRSYEIRNDKRREHDEKTQNKPMLSEMSAEEQAIGQALSSFVITTIITL
ncbi:translation initiation factor IF-2 [Erysipelothrix amsterdamensis]|uniref:Translation initiation factor IF-2 n=1 Tax=Erysipelothrix amsterdamensis TaxID=2929157 RepID=A0AAU9VKX2_9FIRM|nr:translation initiation factor IF-2 [Erysipelothrix sp. A18Y020d]CAH2763182.1 translation initiation factor IF-2 [Erysipelothrix sp. A18Y020d]